MNEDIKKNDIDAILDGIYTVDIVAVKKRRSVSVFFEVYICVVLLLEDVVELLNSGLAFFDLLNGAVN